MGERKVTNKYIPPDFDPAKLKIGRKKRNKDKKKRDDVRAMLPFSCQCLSCKTYLYRGKKFNSRKEATGETYLGIKILRLFVKCPTCSNQITFQTDPATSDYKMEKGGLRLYEAKNNDQFSGKDTVPEDEKQKKNITDKVDAMETLEARAKKSKEEMQTLEILDQIKQKNKRYERINTASILDVIHSSTKGDIEKEIQEDQLDSLEAMKAFHAAKKQQQQQQQYNVKTIKQNIDHSNNDQSKMKLSNMNSFKMLKKRKANSLSSTITFAKKLKSNIADSNHNNKAIINASAVKSTTNSNSCSNGALDFLNMCGSDSDSDSD